VEKPVENKKNSGKIIEKKITRKKERKKGSK